LHHRLPDPRAAAIFAMEEVKSLAEHVPVTVVIPLRNTTDIEKAHALYALPPQVTLVALPILEVSHIPFLRRFAFQCSLLSFAVNLVRYLRRNAGVWIVTTDHVPALIAVLFGKKVLIEIHDFPTVWNPVWRFVLSHASLVLSTNEWKKNELPRHFRILPERIFCERNGVDLKLFAPMKQDEARTQLAMPLDAKIALYTGNLYSWKGVETFIDAAALIPNILCYIVGGTIDDHRRLEERIMHAHNIRLIPRVPHTEVPLWQAAADVLVLPNTASEEISLHYTSPMKLFEYMASHRPIVASDLPSIREILPNDAGYFYAPDNAQALAGVLATVCADSGEASQRSERALHVVREHAWSARALRIIKHMQLV